MLVVYMKIASELYLSGIDVFTFIRKNIYLQDKVKFSIISYRRIGTVCDQEIRKEKSAKTSSTSELMEIREANISINWKKGYTIVMLNKSSP